MKKLVKISAFLSLMVFCSITFQNTEAETTSKDEELVKQHVLEWADTTFYHHEDYRFEQFHAFYTEEYQIATLRAEMYTSKLENLEKLKAKGFYKKSDAEYEKEHAALTEKVKNLNETAENFENKAEYYQILFWSNIKTNHGITVYYSHQVKLNNAYEVVSAEIKSEIGKKNEKTKILYSKDVKKKK